MKLAKLFFLMFTVFQTTACIQSNEPMQEAPLVREGGEQRDLLVNEANRHNLGDILITDRSWIDVPGYDDRSFWDGLPEAMRQQYIQRAEAYLDFDWPAVQAAGYLRVILPGGDELSEGELYDSRARRALEALFRGEMVEGQGRFLDQIINGVWYHSEQTWWGHPRILYRGEAPDGLPDPDALLIDLRVGDVSKMLAWVHYFFKDEFDKVHPLIARRLKDEIMNKVVNLYMERDLFYWWWMGYEDSHGSHHVNNWVPWVHSNILTSILLLEDDPQQMAESVQKVLRGLDIYINTFPEDGATDEGPGYWGAAIGNLYRSLRLLEKATGGKLDLFDHSLIQNMGKYIYQVHIAGPYFLNFADAGPTSGSGGDRGALIYRYGKTINDPVMQKFGAFLAQNSSGSLVSGSARAEAFDAYWGQTTGGSFDQEMLESAFNAEFRNEILSAPAEEPLLASFWLPQTGIGGARDKEGSAEGFYFAAKGGTNHESHNHNDVGSCMFYVDGKPALIDVGRDTYIGSTFGAERYEIWNNQSQYHNLPKINGVDQAAGNEYRAQNTDFTDDGQTAIFTTDIAGAYPEQAGIRSWVRSYTLERGREFVVSDRYELEDVKDGPTTLNFMTATQVSQTGPGILRLEGDGFAVQMQYDEAKATAEIEVLDLAEISHSLDRVWSDGLTRIVLLLNDPGQTGRFDTVFTRID